VVKLFTNACTRPSTPNQRPVCEHPGQPYQASPSIEQLYTEASVPGLTSQPGTAAARARDSHPPDPGQRCGAVELQPRFSGILDTRNANFSFERLVVDPGHEFALYGTTTRILEPRLANGPDDCALESGHPSGVPESSVRNFEGVSGCEL